MFFPFYAYEIVCGENPREEMAEYSGAAFIVAMERNGAVAYYHPSIDAALVTVEEGDWCNRDDDTWHLATEHPLGFPEYARFLSRDVGRIEALVQASRD